MLQQLRKGGSNKHVINLLNFRTVTSNQSPEFEEPPLLLRDYLHQSLAHPTEGYFARSESAVGRLAQPVRFDLLLGESGWRACQQQLYSGLQTSWLTPVEVFKPWYGEAIGRFVVRQHMRHRPDHKLRIAEVGGGQGTLAANILDYLKKTHPSLYKKTIYTSIEVSPALAKKQLEYVTQECNHREHYKVLIGDATLESTWAFKSDSHAYVLAMEVLDNLPHDRVVRESKESPWKETWIKTVPSEQNQDPAIIEELRPLTDPLIQRCLNASDWISHNPGTSKKRGLLDRVLDSIAGVTPSVEQGGDVNCIFVPTGSMQLLETLHSVRPSHQLICADFHDLPDVKMSGLNAPIVSATAGGHNTDYETYLVPKGSADIFFPTNFRTLRDLWKAAGKLSYTDMPIGAIDILSSPAFMTMYAEVHRTKTAAAYNPLVDDFLNTSMFIADSSRRGKL